MTHTTQGIVETRVTHARHPGGVSDVLPEVRRVFDPIATYSAALTEATNDLGATAVAWVAVRSQRREVVIEHVRGEHTAGLHQLSVEAGQGLTGSVFASTKLAWVDDYTGSPTITHHFDDVITSERVTRVIAAPVVAAGTVDAVLAVGRRDTGAFGGRELDRIERAARRASKALEVARASRDHARAAALAERRRLSEDLHDGLGARLFTVSARLDRLSRRADGPELHQLQREVADLQRLVRSLVGSWHAEATQDLHAELRALVDDFSARCAVRASCLVLGGLPELDAARRTAIVRLVAIALANVERHAQATAVTVTLASVPGRVSVAIVNDGPVPRAPLAPGVGLMSARRQWERLGGEVQAAADDGEGFLVRAWLPW